MADNTAAHIRIDEGIKRGKRGPKKQRIALQRPKEPVGLSPIVPATLDPKEVLERYLSEPRTSQIAESYGVTRRNLVRWLREVVPNEWKQVQIVRALVFKEDGTEGLETAADALALARAREIVKSAQWELERLDSANYGPKQEVTHTLQPVPADVLREIAELRQELLGLVNVAETPNAALLPPIDVEPEGQEGE